jgi:hypothetical protein
MLDEHRFEIQDLLEWNIDRNINPKTNRKIKKDGSIYQSYLKKYVELFPNDINFFDADDKEPISLTRIWVEENNKKKFVYPNYENLILYKDENNIINCFEKNTINDFITYNIKIHPVTFSKIPDNVFNMINYKKKIIEKTIPQRTLEVFQIFIKISIFIDSEEFLELNSIELDKLYYETSDFFIKNLSESLINNIKIYGNKEKKHIFNFTTLEFNEFELEKKQTILLDSFEILLTYENDQVKSMSYYIILGGLSLLIPKIKESYPDFCFSF